MEQLLLKKVQNSFLQYGRNLNIDPLLPEEKQWILEKLEKAKLKDPSAEWYELVEDVVYDYVTNQDGEF
ncbi:YqzH family protein [Metabacillus arenae]|uniref:YqzH-like protein n=1 Tax=Metabacillus arenae TaxID=2771434 RepID=A0A926NEX0_9BACI|nr:YqzH family protein [Metabacillus arenae]MBD1378743.1 hypothetical protein [Metabacillus arenae]